MASFLWLAAPMSQRETIASGGGTLEDTLHLAMAGLTAALWRREPSRQAGA